MSEPVILFIVEGEDRDYRFVHEMSTCFFTKGKYKSVVIKLPAAQNIYMLYELLAKDDFESDIVEVLREAVEGAEEILKGVKRQNINEVYLLFDYDIHQNNLSQASGCGDPDQVIERMLTVFDNETENGKLYISYPMVEALYDYQDSKCEAFYKCILPVAEVGEYKTHSGTGNIKSSQRFAIDEWKMVLNVFALRIKCLFDLDSLDYSSFRERITPISIHRAQCSSIQTQNGLVVLSAFPELLFDYFPEYFWKSMVHTTHFKFDTCAKQKEKQKAST